MTRYECVRGWSRQAADIAHCLKDLTYLFSLILFLVLIFIFIKSIFWPISNFCCFSFWSLQTADITDSFFYFFISLFRFYSFQGEPKFLQHIFLWVYPTWDSLRNKY